jgi:membrane associated rhomboid family serine protease
MEFSITLVIVIISGIVSYRAFTDSNLLHRLKHDPYREAHHKEYYRFITSGFVHGGWAHLIINMYVLYEFGTIVESLYSNIFGPVTGKVYYLILYFGTLVISDIPTYLKHKDKPGYGSIGASGAVSGVLFAYVLFSPWSWLGLFFVIPIPAIVFAVLYLIYSSWAVNNTQSRIDHSAHFMGAVAGVVITVILFPQIISIFSSEVMNFQAPW